LVVSRVNHCLLQDAQLDF